MRQDCKKRRNRHFLNPVLRGHTTILIIKEEHQDNHKRNL